MKALVIALPLLVLGSVVDAQSLTELASKERARREANAESGSAAVLSVGEGELRDVREHDTEEAADSDDVESSADVEIEDDDYEQHMKKLREELEEESARCSADVKKYKPEYAVKLPTCLRAGKLRIEMKDYARRAKRKR